MEAGGGEDVGAALAALRGAKQGPGSPAGPGMERCSSAAAHSALAPPAPPPTPATAAQAHLQHPLRQRYLRVVAHVAAAGVERHDHLRYRGGGAGGGGAARQAEAQRGSRGGQLGVLAGLPSRWPGREQAASIKSDRAARDSRAQPGSALITCSLSPSARTSANSWR